MEELVELFEQASLSISNDEEAMMELFDQLPDAPDLKVGDKVKVLRVIDTHATAGMSNVELEFATATQGIFSVITRSIQRGNIFHTLACLKQYSLMTEIQNQLTFVSIDGNEGEPIIAAIELDIPFSKAFFEVTASHHNGVIEVGGDMMITRVFSFYDFEEEYQQVRDTDMLIDFVGKQLKLEPEDGIFYSFDQKNEILHFAESLGLIETKPSVA